MPKVSIVIPSYNHEEYIEECIQSVLDQTYQDFNIIVRDDVSTDNTCDKAVAMSKLDDRIKVIRNEENYGYGVNISRLINDADGEYIGLLCSDDKYLSDKLEIQTKILDENSNIGAVFSFAEAINENSGIYIDDHLYKHIFNQTNRNRYEWLNFFFTRGNCLCQPSVLCRKKCYEEVGPYYDPRFSQLGDWDFWIRLVKRYEIFIVPRPLVCFRILEEGKNASGFTPDSIFRSSVEHKEILKNFLTLTGEDFLKAFPNYKETLSVYLPEYNKDINLIEELEEFPLMVKFHIAILAIVVRSATHLSFAIDTLYDLFKDPGVVGYLKENYGFGYPQLQKVTGRSM